jgi:heme exporter protein C
MSMLEKEIRPITEQPLPKLPRSHQALIWLAIPMVLIALYLTFIWSSVEVTMGVVQKIFYFHVGSAWNAFLAFGVVFACSIGYLITRKRSYDIVAGVSAEIGVIFTVIVLTTGPIWARSAWNTWWSWEPRLTTTLILLFIYLAYLMIRNMDGPWEKRARLTAVFGIIGFLDVPIVFMAIRWWAAKMHPIVFGSSPTQQGGGVSSDMLVTLIFSVITLTIVYVILLQKGVYLEKLKIELAKWKEKMQDKFVQ